jgi:alpha-mannosidase
MFGNLNRRKLLFFLIAAVCLGFTVIAYAVDLGTEKTLYTVATAHLDTQWQWTIKDTINSYILATLDQNFALFPKYPDYQFNFEGSFRYQLMKEYYPDKYLTMKQYIQQGRWNVCGSSVDANDVNLPSPESQFRGVLYGNGYFKSEFGKTSTDIFLPDCFGFGYALPSIAAHAGLKGFSTQKLGWGCYINTPFDIGRWIGVDGSSVIAALGPGAYDKSITSDLSNDSGWLNKINGLGGSYGVYAGYTYHGTGDRGGAPSDSSANWAQQSVNGTGPVNVLSAPADQMYKDITPTQAAGLPSYNGELVMSTHGVGCYTSKAIGKRWNRQNELLADAAERASVMAQWLGGASYPQQRLNEAWVRFLWHQFHDDLTGTSIPSAYTYSWNDYIISLNQFAGELTNGVGVNTRVMDTQTTGTPLVVYNPTAVSRKDIVEAKVYFPGGVPAAVKVYDPTGAEVPSQLGPVDGNYATVLFQADLPSVGYKVYDVRSSATPCSIGTGLSVTNTSVENNRYRVTVNSGGDISSIYDKTNSRELLSSPIRLQMLNDNSTTWPAWELLYNDVIATPREYVSGTVTASIVENGPARVALQINRTTAGSTISQRIRLFSGDDANRVEIDNDVDWNSMNTLLKAAFPFGVSNATARYDLGLGTITRGNNYDKLYEVPAQQWADLTDASGAYGVAVLNDCKYGWDKPNNNTLRLSLIHSPSGTGYGAQNLQDIGKHKFLYAIYGHTGAWDTANIASQGERVNQPLRAFQAVKHSGGLGKTYSFLSVSNPQVAVKAVKKAENSNEIIVRVQETRGQSASNVLLSMGNGITAAREVNGFEDPVGSATISSGSVSFSIGAYKPKTFALTLANPPTNVSAPSSTAVSLTYNKDAVSFDSNRSNGSLDALGVTIPAELFPSTITDEGIQFQTGPTADGQNNAVSCAGQNIQLTAGSNTRLYILANSLNGDANVTFTMNGTPVALKIQDYKANVGQWYNNPLGTLPNIKRDPIAWVATHRHTPTANNAYDFIYLFKYRIDLPAGVSNPTLTLPNNSNIIIYAMTLSNNSNDDTAPATLFYDSASSSIGQNYALNTSATANQYVTGEEPSKAVDGAVDNNSKWCSNVGGDKWLRLDLGQSYSINRWIVKHAGAGGEDVSWNTSDFKLQKSSDGTTFTDVDSVTGNTANITDRTVTAFSSRYVRLYITKPTNSADSAARIYELELYGNQGPTPTPTPTPTPGPTATSTPAQSPTPTATPGPTATPTPTPLPGGDYIIDNFESGIASWSTYQGTGTVSIALAAGNPGNAMAITYTGGDYWGVQKSIQKDISAYANFSIDMKATNSNPVRLVITEFGTDGTSEGEQWQITLTGGTSFSTTVVSLSSGFTKRSDWQPTLQDNNGVFNRNNLKKIEFMHSNSNAGNLTVDNIKLTGGTATATPASTATATPTATPIPTATPTPTPATTATPTPTPSGSNLALNKTTTVSSIESSGYTGSKAVDGSGTTRWSSAQWLQGGTDIGWIYVDLGQSYSIGRVKLTWEAAYAVSYKIQTSNDAATWTDIYSTTSGAGGTSDLSVTGSGRYVRVYCTQHTGIDNYSIWEFEVY